MVEVEQIRGRTLARPHPSFAVGTAAWPVGAAQDTAEVVAGIVELEADHTSALPVVAGRMHLLALIAVVDTQDNLRL